MDARTSAGKRTILEGKFGTVLEFALQLAKIRELVVFV